MAYMVSTSLSIHRAQRIEAKSNTKSTLTLTFLGDPDASAIQHNMAEVTVFMDDHELVERLIAAINSQNIEIEPPFTPYHMWKGEDDEPAF